MPKVDIKKLPASRVEVAASLNQKEFKEYFDRFFNAALENVEIKGFRKGTAPKELAASAIDTESVFHKAANEAVRETFNDIVEENKWTLIEKPEIELMEAKEGISFKTVCTLFPIVKLPDYKKIGARIEEEYRKNIEAITVPAQEIDDAKRYLQNSRATESLVAREARKGDLLEIDVEGKIDGKPLEGATMQGEKLIVGESRFIPGFDTALIGTKSGETRTFTIPFPDEYWQKDLAKKQCEFTVSIKSVYERTLPEFNDAFAKSLGSQFATIADVEKSIQEGLKEEKVSRETDTKRGKIIETIAKEAAMEIPEIMIERTYKGMLEDVKRMRGGEPDEVAKKAIRIRAEESVRGNVVMHEIAREESLLPTDEEVREEALKSHLDPDKAYDYTYGRVLEKKFFSFFESLNQ